MFLLRISAWTAEWKKFRGKQRGNFSIGTVMARIPVAYKFRTGELNMGRKLFLAD